MANQYTTGRVKGDPRWVGNNGKYDNRVYMAEYSQRPENKERRRKYIQERHLEFQKWLAQLQTQAGCLRCGERDPRCLQFHHRDPQTKKYDVTTMSGRNRDVVLEEMDKCDVLCANCHYKIHAAAWMNDIDWMEIWICDSCGHKENKEAEVKCWNCSKGEMLYRGQA